MGGLPAVALPGGDLAATQPWRNLLAQMLAFVPDWQNFPKTAVLQRQNWPVLARAIARNINAPMASSTGRLFDAVACALDCAPLQLSYEGGGLPTGSAGDGRRGCYASGHAAA